MSKPQPEVEYRLPGIMLPNAPFDTTKLQLLDLLLSSFPATEDRDLQQRRQLNQHLLNKLSTTTLAQCVQHTSEMSILLTSHHLRYALEMCTMLDIDDGCLISWLVTELENKQTGIISTSHVEHYIDLYGKEHMRNIFIDPQLIGERLHIIEQCSYTSFPCADYFHLSNVFMEDVGVLTPMPPSPTYQASPQKETHFLGSLASEISYLKEIFGIPLKQLLTLDKATLGDLCGTLRSLTNQAGGLTNTPHRDFDMSKTPVAIDPSVVFTHETILPLMQAHSDVLQQTIYTEVHDKVIRLITFIQQQTTVTLPPLLTQTTEEISAQLYKLTIDKLQSDYASAKKKYDRRRKYEQNPEKYYQEKQRKGGRLGRNFAIITSLARTLHSDNPLTETLLPVSLRQQQSTLGLIRAYHQNISQLAEKYAGLYSIGGKIHFPSAIDAHKIYDFKKQFGLDATSFKLLHANTSLLLPPSNFPEELLFMINCMEEAGLIDNDPQLQISIPGRLSNQLGALLGSSMILLSEQHVQYAPESFGTTHTSATGRRMVVYDAGVYDNAFMRNSDKITGRTDVLLLKDVNLIPKAQVVGSLLSQTEYDGRFAQLGVSFIQAYAELLDRHNLLRAVQGPWIYNEATHNEEDPDASLHFAQINALTEHQKEDFLIAQYTKQTKGLLVFELRELLTKYRKKIQDIQQHFSK